MALLNVIPDNSQEHVETGNYLPYAKFVEFLREVFALWWQEFRDSVSIRELESLFSKVAARRGPTICEFASNCMGKYLTIEPNGDVLACDKYLGDPALLFGNLLTENLSQLLVHSSNLTRTSVLIFATATEVVHMMLVSTSYMCATGKEIVADCQN